jgi:hypothetical protein
VLYRQLFGFPRVVPRYHGLCILAHVLVLEFAHRPLTFRHHEPSDSLFNPLAAIVFELQELLLLK